MPGPRWPPPGRARGGGSYISDLHGASLPMPAQPQVLLGGSFGGSGGALMPADAGAPGMSRETLNPEPGMSPGSGFPLREMTMLEEDPVACHPGCTCGDCWQRMPPELAPVAWPEAPPQWPLTAMVRCSDIEEMRARVRRWIASGYLARAFLATLRSQVKIKAERAEVRTALWGAAAASGAAAPDAVRRSPRLTAHYPDGCVVVEEMAAEGAAASQPAMDGEELQRDRSRLEAEIALLRDEAQTVERPALEEF